MSRRERQADDAYEAENDQPPVSGTIYDSSYTGATKGEPIDVVEDQEDVDVIEPEIGYEDVKEPAKDDMEDIDKSNIMKDRTRHAKPQSETKYDEGPMYEDELRA
ncbi:hypothetical protein VTO42DRAFT_1530 [Malbranchea cinnamomea]